MSLDPGAPAGYLVGHLEDALARDERVSEQGVRVEVDTDRRVVSVTGTVSTVERQQNVVDVIRELLAGYDVHNGTVVAEYPEDAAVDHVPAVDRVEEVQ